MRLEKERLKAEKEQQLKEEEERLAAEATAARLAAEAEQERIAADAAAEKERLAAEAEAAARLEEEQLAEAARLGEELLAAEAKQEAATTAAVEETPEEEAIPGEMEEKKDEGDELEVTDHTTSTSHEQLVAPRELSEEESAELKDMLKDQMLSYSDDDEEDVVNMLDYVIDMINGGESVGHVTEELPLLEMPFCDEGAARKMGSCIAEYFTEFMA